MYPGDFTLKNESLSGSEYVELKNIRRKKETLASGTNFILQQVLKDSSNLTFSILANNPGFKNTNP
jgi:hypothetical protein